MRRFTILIFILCSIQFSKAQGIAIGEWREHLPYSSVTDLALHDNTIYAATPYGLFYYNYSDGLVTRLNRINGLSDIGVSAIKFVEDKDFLIICYKNTNIDFLFTDGRIINLPDIKRKTIVGNKTINNVTIDGNIAYLSCGFGIISINLDKLEIKDTYYIGENGGHLNVYDLAICDTLLIAASENGLYSANKNNPDLSYFGNWEKINSIPNSEKSFSNIVNFNDSIFVIQSNLGYNNDTIYYFDGNEWKQFSEAEEYVNLNVSSGKLIICRAYNTECYDSELNSVEKVFTYDNVGAQPNDAIYSKDGIFLYIADNNIGLARTWNSWNYESICPNGPVEGKTFAFGTNGKAISAVYGGYDVSFQNIYSNIIFYTFIDEKWKSYTPANIPELEPYRDAISIQVDPNDNEHIFVGTFSKGLLEIKNSVLTHIYNDSTSSLDTYQGASEVKVCGVKYDNNGNLWFTTSGTPNFLSVIKANGTLKTFHFPSSYKFDIVGNIEFDNNDNLWINLPRNEGIFVFNYNGTIDNTSDDKYQKISGSNGYGALHDLYINDIAKDKDNEMWIATNDGVTIIYNPSNVFSSGSFDAQQILVEIDGVVEPLFNLEKVNCIAVDGANRKWIGTENSGAFLINDNGQKEIFHFTKDNSPLFSNNILDITIQPQSGEVFFATTEGIISFRSTATEGNETMDSLMIFPNPVKRDFNGYVSISGLTEESWVSITDVYGNLVYKGQSLGGQFVWDCLDVYGNRPATGVYIVFASNADGTIKKSGKFMFFK